ncbi:MAG: hypothetical protein RLZZ528_430 [Pseudomonadota bacterium]
MTMSDKHIVTDTDDEMLAGFFAQVRQGAADPSEALLARVLADAAAEMPKPRPMAAAASGAVPAGGGWFGSMLAGLGGWGGLGGLASAAVAGVWIGFSGQIGSTTLTDYLGTGSTGTVELYPGAEDFLVSDASEG